MNELTGNLGTNQQIDDLIIDYVRHSLDPDDRKLLDGILAGKSKVQIAKELRVSPATITVRSKKIADMIDRAYNLDLANVP